MYSPGTFPFRERLDWATCLRVSCGTSLKQAYTCISIHEYLRDFRVFGWEWEAYVPSGLGAEIGLFLDSLASPPIDDEMRSGSTIKGRDYQLVHLRLMPGHSIVAQSFQPHFGGARSVGHETPRGGTGAELLAHFFSLYDMKFNLSNTDRDTCIRATMKGTA